MNSYGSLNLTDTSPAQSFTEPLTLAEVKQVLRLPERSPADEAEGALLELYITAARNVAEVLQGRDLVQKQYDLSLDWFPGEIALRSPLQSVDLVEYRDSDGNYTTLAEGTDYIVDTSKHPGIVLPAYGESWPSFTPWPSSPILIRFTSGYDAAAGFWAGDGALVKKGMLLLTSGWYSNEIPFQQQGASAIQEFPFAVTAALSFGALTRAR